MGNSQMTCKPAEAHLFKMSFRNKGRAVVDPQPCAPASARQKKTDNGCKAPDRYRCALLKDSEMKDGGVETPSL